MYALEERQKMSWHSAACVDGAHMSEVQVLHHTFLHAWHRYIIHTQLLFEAVYDKK